MIQSVKVKNLTLSKDNVRKSNRDAGIDTLAANIAAQGLLQNLIVTPLKKAGTFTVKAGGRRLRALQLLIQQGTLPADHTVPVLVLSDDDNSIEASLAENFQRVPMNPADECTAFNFLIHKGMTAEDVAKRQGVTTRFVEQRVRLAELAPPVFEALAAGEITLGVAQAYAVTSDVDRQTRVFAQMKSSYYGDNPDNIRRAILNGTVKANDAKARFVGREAYVAAGGRIEGDLFATEGDENWIDVDLIETLAASKLEAAAAELAQAEGLAFVTPIAATHVPYDLERQLHEYHAPARALTEDETARVEVLSTENDALIDQLEQELPEGSAEAEAANARIEAIERELETIEDARHEIDPALKSQIGTFVYIGGDGEPRVHTRLFSEKPVVDPNAPPKASDGATGDGDAGDGEQGPKLSATLIDELATQRRQILVAHVASDPGLALDLTIFLMAQNVVFEQAHIPNHSTLKSSAAGFPIFAFRDEGSMASQTIDDQRQKLDTSWAGLPTMTARFDAFRALDDEARGAWVCLNPIRRPIVAQTTDKPSPADIITNTIIDKLESGVRPWVKPWRPGLGGRPLRATGDPYKGINCFWLWLCAEGAGYNSRTWMTYKQAQALGGQVREGERSQIAIFYKSYSKTVESVVTGDTTDEMRRVLRSYAVFNCDQIEGLSPDFYPSPVSIVPPADALPERAQRFLDALPATVHTRGDRAFYDRTADSITMPPVELFSTRAYFAATLAHEAGHWTGHPDRLDRTFGKRFGDDAYAFEELCAEMTSALLGADLGLPTSHMDDHAAYIGSWLKVLRKDSRAIMTAAAKAEAAAGYLLRATGLDASVEPEEQIREAA